MLSELPVYIACMCLLSLSHEYVYEQNVYVYLNFIRYICISKDESFTWHDQA
jgi:hypothetical protein